MISKRVIVKAIGMGLISTMLLSTGLLVNTLLAWKGNHWAWTASLRFTLLIPLLAIILACRRELRPLIKVLLTFPQVFILWGCLGFGVYYAFLSFAALSAPGWLVTAAFQTTVLASVLISPIVYKDHRAKIQKKSLLLSTLLVIGLFIMQADRLSTVHVTPQYLLSILLSLGAAFLWPLGNRKVLVKLDEAKLSLNPMQRVLGMSLGSLPVLLILSLYGYHEVGLPGKYQVLSSMLAVTISGVLGFVLFFHAIGQVKQDMMALATVEATQVTGVIFILFGEMWIKGTPWPGALASFGFILVALCLSVYSYLSGYRVNPLRIVRKKYNLVTSAQVGNL